MPNIARILTIDGGGIRGIIPATVLRHIEDRLGRPAASVFHMVAGTSTGGIIAVGLTRPDPLPAARLVDLYATRGREIFSRSAWKQVESLRGVSDERYEHVPLERILGELLGGAKLSDVSQDLLVTAYEIERRQPVFFKSWKARGRDLADGETAARRDFLLRDVARATSAAPTYFEPAPVRSLAGDVSYLIDGGVYANNPGMCALASARHLYPRADGYFVVSLGTGELEKPIPYAQAKDWGDAGWLRSVLSVIFDGVSDTVDYQLAQELPGDGSYVRLQIGLGPVPGADAPSDDMDEVSKDNVAKLQARAELLVRRQAETLARVVERLSEPMTEASALGSPVVA